MSASRRAAARRHRFQRHMVGRSSTSNIDQPMPRHAPEFIVSAIPPTANRSPTKTPHRVLGKHGAQRLAPSLPLRFCTPSRAIEISICRQLPDLDCQDRRAHVCLSRISDIERRDHPMRRQGDRKEIACKRVGRRDGHPHSALAGQKTAHSSTRLDRWLFPTFSIWRILDHLRGFAPDLKRETAMSIVRGERLATATASFQPPQPSPLPPRSARFIPKLKGATLKEGTLIMWPSTKNF